MRRFNLVAVSTLLACAGSAVAVPATRLAEMVYAVDSHVAGAETKANVPGYPGVRFTNFATLFRTPTTKKWSVVATTNAPSTDGVTPVGFQDQFYLVGTGLSGAILAREGVTEFAPAEVITFTGSFPRMNDAGAWALSFQPAVGGSSTNQRLVRYNPAFGMSGGFDLIVRPSDAIPAIGGATYIGAFNAHNINAANGVSFKATILGATGSQGIFTNDGANNIIQNGVTIPTGQIALGMETWTDVDNGAFFSDDSGANYIALGEVGAVTATDKVAVVNGAVVAQEGAVLPNSPFVALVSSISQIWMESDGTWFVRGSNNDASTTQWVLRNGVLIAYEGQQVVSGSPEVWESFQDMKSNNRGDTILIGNTNNPSINDDVVWVRTVNGNKRVIVRESDAIDLNNDMIAQSDMFVHLLQDRVTLDNDGYAYFATRLKPTAAATAGINNSINASLLRVNANLADVDNSGSAQVADIFAFLNIWFTEFGSVAPIQNADHDSDGAVAVADIFAFLNDWFAYFGL